MADVSFTQTFHHLDWVDDVDRVRADEPNGFNARFNAIEADLQQLSAVVAQVDAALGQQTGAGERTLTFPPQLRPAWSITSSGAANAPAGLPASGQLTLALPDGVRLTSFRALGQADGTTVAISLSRIPISDNNPQVLASVTGDANPFDKAVSIDPAVATTATGTYRYLVGASVPSTQSGAVTLAAFQITYTAE
ncbi:hypothetical protein [Actinophytocola sp.]|uniref:hypothetical protein n=1 Tax=Actinophytocola sp. TaxID=1872138 RepID=UPI00389ABE82